MKFILSLFTVVALVAFASASVLKSPSSRANLNIGNIYAGDRILHSQYVYQPPRANTVQSQDVVFRGNRSNRITAIRANELGYTQFAAVWLLAGGVGYQNVTLRVQSARGYGYYYQIDIWGR